MKSAVFRAGVETVARLILAMALASLAAACNQTGLTPSPVPNPVTGQNPDDVKYYPSDQPVRLGTQRFYDGNFGLAQHYFQDAVEKSPEDVMAWIGLAASYDRLGRFDLADHAYEAAAKLEGETPRLLNNEGYSYMLRGDLKAARAKFHQALGTRSQQSDNTQQHKVAELEPEFHRPISERRAVRQCRLRAVTRSPSWTGWRLSRAWRT